jgi:hypothetical protein
LLGGFEHRFVDLETNDADAVVMAGDGAAYREQSLRLATRTAPGRIAHSFAVAAQVSFGKIYERGLLHEFTSTVGARMICPDQIPHCYN